MSQCHIPLLTTTVSFIRIEQSPRKHIQSQTLFAKTSIELSNQLNTSELSHGSPKQRNKLRSWKFTLEKY